MALNFDNVQDAQSSNMILPGTIGIFTIKDVEAGVTPNSKEYLKVTFENENGSFSHSFYLSEKALPRVQHLWMKSHNGEMLKGEIEINAIVAGLINRKVGLKVGGTISNKGKTYPDLAFGGFASLPTQEDLANLKFSAREQMDVDAALDNMKNQSVNNATKEDSLDAVVTDATATDLPFSESTTTDF